MAHLAIINNLVYLFIWAAYPDFFTFEIKGNVYVLIMSSSRLVQTCLCDYYIAHMERLRYTRGWDGLHTSQFPTKDLILTVD